MTPALTKEERERAEKRAEFAHLHERGSLAAMDARTLKKLLAIADDYERTEEEDYSILTEAERWLEFFASGGNPALKPAPLSGHQLDDLLQRVKLARLRRKEK